MPTLRQIVSDMLLRSPADSIGREEAVTALAVGSVTCGALGVGTVSSQKFVNQWLWRNSTATAADRYRMCSAFTPSTGLLAHAGSNFGDTTVGSETCFILQYEPRTIIDAIQAALQRTRYQTTVRMTAIANGTKHPIPFSWLTKPTDVEQVGFISSPLIGRNRDFTHWGSLQSTGGTLAADDWTLSGTGATLARSTTSRRGPYAASLTRATNNVTLRQTIPLLHSGVDGDSLLSDTVMIVGVGQTSTASHLRFTVTSGATTSSTSYHTGDGSWQELSTSITVPSTATSVLIDAEVNGTDAAAIVDEIYAVRGTSTVTDTMRRNDYGVTSLPRDEYHWEQYTGGMSLLYPTPGIGQFELIASRPYPQFDNARILAGSGDGDSTDCPLDVVSIGALAMLFAGLSRRSGEDTSRYQRLADEFRQKWQRTAASYRLVVNDREGVDIPVARKFATIPVAY